MRTQGGVVHPGVFVGDELSERGWTQTRFAQIIGVSPAYVCHLVVGRRNMSPAMAVRIAAAFGTSPELWMNLHRDWELAHVFVEEDAIRQRAAEASR